MDLQRFVLDVLRDEEGARLQVVELVVLLLPEGIERLLAKTRGY